MPYQHILSIPYPSNPSRVPLGRKHSWGMTRTCRFGPRHLPSVNHKILKKDLNLRSFFFFANMCFMMVMRSVFFLVNELKSCQQIYSKNVSKRGWIFFMASKYINVIIKRDIYDGVGFICFACISYMYILFALSLSLVRLFTHFDL